ncbi:MAG: hypothetical protein MRY83_10455 [Flavobacteriales bacterium]|nr:hypothetical protein [Flavobacteriales bacterium]
MNSSFFIFQNLKECDINDLQQGTSILIYDVYHTPPHLFLGINGNIFSLGTSGLKFFRNVHSFLRLSKTKNKGVLVVKLKPSGLVMSLDEVIEVFRFYEKANYDVTCLNPISNVISQQYNIEFTSNSVIFDVLGKLEAKSMINEILHFNVNLQGSDLRLKKYDIEDVKNHLNQLIH